jgi:hypothetical protein
MTTRSGGDRIGDIGLHFTDRVTETTQRFREQSGDHCVVLHDQSAQRYHRIALLLRRPRSLRGDAVESRWSTFRLRLSKKPTRYVGNAQPSGDEPDDFFKVTSVVNGADVAGTVERAAAK